MPIAYDGQVYEDGMSYEAATNPNVPQELKKVFITGKDEPETASTMPLQGPTEATGALKQGEGSLPSVGEPLLGLGEFSKGTDLGNQLADFHAQKLYGIGQGIVNAMALPGDVLSGKVEPGSPQEIERAFDLAGLMVLGPAPVAAKMADGTLGSFAGVRSKNYDKGALEVAQAAEREGVHPDEIWNKTGWFKGADNRWRYEIDDSGSKLSDAWMNSKDTGTYQAKLGTVLDHPDLYAAYPHLKNINIKVADWYGPGNAEWDGKTILMGTKAAKNKGIIMHEVQHAIQDSEIFAKGGAPGTQGKDYELKYEPDINKLRSEFINLQRLDISGGALSRKEQGRLDFLTHVFKKYAEYSDAGRLKARDNYLAIAGETESRNVQARLDLDPIERTRFNPVDTEDVPRSAQIVLSKPSVTTPYGVVDPGVQYNMLGDLYDKITGNNKTKITEVSGDKQNTYPDTADALQAIQEGFGYGTGLEPYINAEVARVYDKAIAGDLSVVLNADTTNEKLDKLSNLGLRQKIGTIYAQAALASNRSAIATLGFDPTKINLQTKLGPASLGGFFIPTEDKIWSNVFKGNESTIVHESIHRGMEELRKKSPEAKKILSDMYPEEKLVRYMMYKTMGDPEGKLGIVDEKQRQESIDLYEKNPDLQKKLDRLEEIAAEIHKDKRPRGPH